MTVHHHVNFQITESLPGVHVEKRRRVTQNVKYDFMKNVGRNQVKEKTEVD